MPDAIRFDLRALLAGVEAAPPMGGVEALASELTARVGAAEVSFLIADLLGGSLARLARAQSPDQPPAVRERPESVPIHGSPAGLALRTQQVQVRDDDDDDGADHRQGNPRVWVHAPVTARGEAVGVLELLLDGPLDEQQLAYLAEAAHALAYVVIADRRYTDLYEWGQRSTPLALQAEIQRRLLPGSYTCEARQFTLAGWQVPAQDVGGDTFDFALDRDTLHLSITDAVGHGVAAALLATLLVASLRNSRRSQMSILQQAQNAEDAVSEHAQPEHYATGQLIRVDLATGTCQMVNAGHTPALLVRHGTVTDIALLADPPFRLLPDTTYRCQDFQLHAGDRLVLLTDGMLERNAAEADVRDLLGRVVDQHPREVVQVLSGAVLQAADGHLRDDATNPGIGLVRRARPAARCHRRCHPPPSTGLTQDFSRCRRFSEPDHPLPATIAAGAHGSRPHHAPLGEPRDLSLKVIRRDKSEQQFMPAQVASLNVEHLIPQK